MAETEEDNRPFHFKGDTCMAEFLEWLDTLTTGNTCDVTVIAHNFQGYDGYFVMDEYHHQNLIMEHVCNGGKIMQLNFDRICFIDSVFLSNAAVCFSKNLWTDRAQERLFPSSFQHSREPNVCRSNPRAALLYA